MKSEESQTKNKESEMEDENGSSEVGTESRVEFRVEFRGNGTEVSEDGTEFRERETGFGGFRIQCTRTGRNGNGLSMSRREVDS